VRTPDSKALTEAGAITAEVLDLIADLATPGITTQELDDIAEREIRRRGAVPAFKNHLGYPATICASVNDAVVHGVPNEYALKDGDIVTIDLGAKVRGWYSDSALTVPVGEVSVEATNLILVAVGALEVAEGFVRPGSTTGDLGAAVQSYVEGRGMSIIRDCSGHGVGQTLHEEPTIPNFGKPGKGTAFQLGMAVAVEPIIAAGDYHLRHAPDRWTLLTRDGSLAAHEEATFLVTDDEPILLTPVTRRLRGKKPAGRLGKVA
jgi:methionyl aminopeptidase